MKHHIIIAIICLATQATPLLANTQTWTYSGKNGPKQWGTISRDYNACKSGKSQSPINIISPQATGSNQKPLISYQKSKISLGNSYQHLHFSVNPGNEITLNGKTYKLKQLDLHIPSEHSVKDTQFAAEIQAIHENEDGNYLILSFLGNTSKTDAPIFNALVNTIPDSNTPKTIDFNLKTVITTKQNYYSYKGSLTTPPCVENVQWLIVNTPLDLSQKTKNELKKVMDNQATNRPIQALNDRLIEIH